MALDHRSSVHFIFIMPYDLFILIAREDLQRDLSNVLAEGVALHPHQPTLHPFARWMLAVPWAILRRLHWLSSLLDVVPLLQTGFFFFFFSLLRAQLLSDDNPVFSSLGGGPMT